MRSGSGTFRERKITSASCEQRACPLSFRACHANDERVLCHFERPEGVEKSADKSVRLTVRATAAAEQEHGNMLRSLAAALTALFRPDLLLTVSHSGIVAPSGFAATLYPGREASSRKNRTLFLCRCHKTGLQGQKLLSSQKNMTIFAGGTHGGAN